MGSKGNKRHQKRIATPGFLQIARKDHTKGKFFMKVRPGAHPKSNSLPLAHIIQDLLKLCDTMKETRYILRNNKVLVDGKVRHDPRMSVGLMDVIEIPELNKAYRILPSHKHGLICSEISPELAKFKLCRIENITTIRGGIPQLNLHDGRNILLTPADGKKYKTKGTLKLQLPDQTILDYYPLEEGVQAIIRLGKNIGVAGKITSLVKRFGVNASLAEIETNGGVISTSYDYIFPIGKESSAIDLPMD